MNKKTKTMLIYSLILTVGLSLGILVGIGLTSLYYYTVSVYETKCNLYGWEFYSFVPEPTCNVFDNKFPLSRLEEMYPDATPFPELPPAKTQEPEKDF